VFIVRNTPPHGATGERKKELPAGGIAMTDLVKCRRCGQRFDPIVTKHERYEKRTTYLNPDGRKVRVSREEWEHRPTCPQRRLEVEEST